MIARFSTVAGEQGAADAERDVRGFALKFYTEEGNWDLVGNNTPVFFVRDPLKFPDFIRTQKRHPRTNLRSPTAMWDFWSLSPESLHQVTILFSDRGLPQSVRHMNGYGSHTYSLVNAQGERHWVKFHFKTRQGHRHWTNAEAARGSGRSRESTQEDLYGAIERGDHPRWTMQVQVMSEAASREHAVQPLRPDEGLAAPRLPADQDRRARAQPQPGQLLRGDRAGRVLAVERRAGHRLLAGQDAAGADLRLRRRAPVPARHALRGAAGQRAAQPRASLPQGRCDAVLRERFRSRTRTTSRTRSAVRRRRPSTASRRFRSKATPTATIIERATTTSASPARCGWLFDAAQRERLYANIAAAMQGVPDAIVQRQLALFTRVHPEYGAGVARKLGVEALRVEAA